MAISSTENRKLYQGDGVTTQFPFPYPYHAYTDLQARTRTGSGSGTVEVSVTLGGTVTVLPLADATAGGTVTFATAPASGVEVVIFRDPPQTQTLDLQADGELPAEAVEKAIDKVVMLVQRIQEQLTRAAVLSQTDESITMTLPYVTDRTSTFLGFDSSGRFTSYVLSDLSQAAVSSFWSTILDETNASNSLVALGASPWMIGNLFDDTSASEARTTLQVDLIRTDVLNSSFSLTAALNYIRADGSVGGFTLSLPTAVGNAGKSIKIKKTDTTYNNITINAVGGELIDGATTTKLTVPYDYIDVISDGTKWGISPRSKTQKSELVLSRFRGHGSASTKILNFSTTEVSVGVGMTLQMDTTVGAAITIAEEGLYYASLNYKDATATFCGISRNQATLTDNIVSIPETQRLALADCPTNAYGHCSVVERLVVGDVIRAVTAGLASGGAETKFRIIKIAD